MSTVLMLAFEFPPATSVGMQRSLKLARHLADHGVKPVVVTTDAESLTAWFDRPLDDSPLGDLPGAVEIRRVPCPRSPIPSGLWARRARRLFSLGEEDIGRHWAPELNRVWDRLLAETRPSAVYVSIPPFSVAPVAAALARRSVLPLVVDFRDNWSQWCHSPHPTWLHYRLTLERERGCLDRAAAVMTTTRQIAIDLQAAHPHVAARKFHVNPGGYDGRVRQSAGREPLADASRPFVIGYVGSFYYLPQARAAALREWWARHPLHWLRYSPRQEDWLYRTPYFFFRALRALFDARPDLRRRVKVRFAGDRQSWLDEQVREFGLQDVVEHLGRLPHADSLAFQAACDALLATSAKVVGGRDPYIAGKTFEYVASGRPVAAFVAEGEQQDFWRQSGMAVLADPDDVAAGARALERLMTGGFTPAPDAAFLDQYRASETARRLAAVVRALE